MQSFKNFNEMFSAQANGMHNVFNFDTYIEAPNTDYSNFGYTGDDYSNTNFSMDTVKQSNKDAKYRMGSKYLQTADSNTLTGRNWGSISLLRYSPKEQTLYIMYSSGKPYAIDCDDAMWDRLVQIKQKRGTSSKEIKDFLETKMGKGKIYDYSVTPKITREFSKRSKIAKDNNRVLTMDFNDTLSVEDDSLADTLIPNNAHTKKKFTKKPVYGFSMTSDDSFADTPVY